MTRWTFSNESGGSMTDPITGQFVEWISKNRVRLLVEGDDPVSLANRLVNLAGELVEWAEKLDDKSMHLDLEPYFRLSVSLGQPRPDQDKPVSSGSMSSMDLDLDDDDDDGEDK